jgi:hypothetical protein
MKDLENTTRRAFVQRWLGAGVWPPIPVNCSAAPTGAYYISPEPALSEGEGAKPWEAEPGVGQP